MEIKNIELHFVVNGKKHVTPVKSLCGVFFEEGKKNPEGILWGENTGLEMVQFAIALKHHYQNILDSIQQGAHVPKEFVEAFIQKIDSNSQVIGADFSQCFEKGNGG